MAKERRKKGREKKASSLIIVIISVMLKGMSVLRFSNLYVKFRDWKQNDYGLKRIA